MNISPTPSPQTRRGWFVTLGLIWLAGNLGAQTPAPPTNSAAKPVTERFLLIVETSAVMQKRAVNVERLVGDLFASGVKEKLHPGDTIGVWTYSDALHTGQFPLQRWTPQKREPIARAIVDFLKHQKYEKKSRLESVMPQLKEVVADSDKITVLLVSSGDETPGGLAYDAPIAEAYRSNVREQRKTQMPFLTVLRAAKGKFVGFKVNTPPWPIEFPSYPPEPKPIASAAPVPTAKPAPPVESKPLPSPVPEPIAKPEPKPATKLEPPVELPPVLPVTNVVTVTNPTPASGIPVSDLKPTVQLSVTNSAPAFVPPLVVSNPPPIISEPAVVSATNPVTPPNRGNDLPEQPSLPFAVLAVGALGILGIVVGIGVWVFRARAKPQASLITRSIDRAGKPPK